MHLNMDENSTCTMLVLESFSSVIESGDEKTGGPDGVCVIPAIRDQYDGGGYHYKTLSEFILALQHLVVDFDINNDEYTTQLRNEFTQRTGNYPIPVKDLALVMATTSSTQPWAEKHLEQFGFKKCGVFPSVKYNGKTNESKGYFGYGSDYAWDKSVVTLWAMPAPDLWKLLFPNGYLGAPANAKELAKILSGEHAPETAIKKASKKLLHAAKRPMLPRF